MSIRGDEWIVGPGDTLRPPRRQKPDRRQARNRPPERRPPHRGGGLLWPIVRAVVAAIVVGGAGVAAYLLLQDEPVPPPPAPIPTVHSVNEAAGYEFDYPKTWKLRVDGTRSIVQHPGRVALVSFGVGPSGNLAAASDVLVEELRNSNKDVETGEPRTQTIAGHPALVVNGTGTSRSDQALRFLAITVHVGDRNYSIVMFAAVDADPEAVVRPAQTILDSFRPPADPPPSSPG